MEDKVTFMDGGDIFLRSPCKEDLKGNWYTWLNDSFITKYQNKGIFPNTIELQEEYYNDMIHSETDVIFSIIEKKKYKHIGSVGLHNIDWIHHSAELGIMIGEKKYLGKGYGKIVWNLITEYAFDTLNLHRVYAFIMVENIPSIKSAEASGYKKVGVIKDMEYKNGKYHDLVLYSVLKEEFKKL